MLNARYYSLWSIMEGLKRWRRGGETATRVFVRIFLVGVVFLFHRYPQTLVPRVPLLAVRLHRSYVEHGLIEPQDYGRWERAGGEAVQGGGSPAARRRAALA